MGSYIETQESSDSLPDMDSSLMEFQHLGARIRRQPMARHLQHMTPGGFIYLPGY